MNHKPDDIINDNRFNHLLTISYSDVIPFVIKYIKKRTLPISLSWIALLASLAWVILLRINIAGSYEYYQILIHSLCGLILLPLALLIPHELLHILPYYLAGARSIRIGADWKQYYFYVTAHKYPVSAGTFTIIALLPFVLINTILIILAFSLDPLWRYSLACTLLAHITMSAGDIALINFCYCNRKRKVITWDDADLKEAYFYEELQ